MMHPGPMNRGVEILVDPAELPGAVITQQVANGVAVRMAVLFELLGAEGAAEPSERQRAGSGWEGGRGGGGIGWGLGGAAPRGTRLRRSL